MMPSIDDTYGQDQMRWYVRVDATVYGPFDDQTLWSYVQEGRITGASELGRHPNGTFSAAAHDPNIAHWFQSVQPAGQVTPQVQPASQTQPTPQPQPQPTQTTFEVYAASAQQQAGACVMLVMAEIPSERAMTFLQTLQSIGDAQRLGHSVWIVRTHLGATQLRDTLATALTATDRLFVMDASRADHATLHLGQMVEARMRHMLASTGS